MRLAQLANDIKHNKRSVPHPPRAVATALHEIGREQATHPTDVNSGFSEWRRSEVTLQFLTHAESSVARALTDVCAVTLGVLHGRGVVSESSRKRTVARGGGLFLGEEETGSDSNHIWFRANLWFDSLRKSVCGQKPTQQRREVPESAHRAPPAPASFRQCVGNLSAVGGRARPRPWASKNCDGARLCFTQNSGAVENHSGKPPPGSPRWERERAKRLCGK